MLLFACLFREVTSTMGGEAKMVFIYIIVGIFIAIGARSAWNIAKMLYATRTVRREYDHSDDNHQSAER